VNRDINIRELTAAINNMVSILDNLNDPDIFKKIVESTRPIMDLFGIALLTNEYSEYNAADGYKTEEFGIPPSIKVGTPNMHCEVSYGQQVSGMVRIRIMAYPYVEEEWDEETKRLVYSFLRIYFHSLARVRMLRMFESRMFQDHTMPFVGNLTSFIRDLGILQSKGELDSYTVYRINIYKFSKFNNIFGRKNGDLILNRYIIKLKSFSSFGNGVYRLGGDNFLGIIPSDRVEDLVRFFEGYTFRPSNELPEIEVLSRAGIYTINDNGIFHDIIINRITQTLAKTTPKNRILFFNIEDEKKEFKNALIDNNFMESMKNGEVIPYYQPKVDIDSGKIVGIEALCRWIRDDEVIPPYIFIPVLERSNHICDLDFYMLDRVCQNIKNWIDGGNNPIPVSINFSRNNLADKMFMQKIIDTIDKHQVPHDLITVELTETTLEMDYEGIIELVTRLKENNVKVAVDDFGMGYSSLNLIKDIDWDILKIDKSFVPNRENPKFQKYLMMLKNVVSLAEDIGMLSVVEGVETEEQLKLVKECGCKVVQGYYYDMPLPREEFEAKLAGTYAGECKWHA